METITISKLDDPLFTTFQKWLSNEIGRGNSYRDTSDHCVISVYLSLLYREDTFIEEDYSRNEVLLSTYDDKDVIRKTILTDDILLLYKYVCRRLNRATWYNAETVHTIIQEYLELYT